jgi:hypothetical protein
LSCMQQRTKQGTIQKEARTIDIGKEKEKITVEPVIDPVPQRAPEPAKEPVTIPEPKKEPVKV